MPRVLMFSYYFPPMGGVEIQRITRFVRHLPEFGWAPIVVAAKGGGHTGKDESILQTLSKKLIIERIPAMEHFPTAFRLRMNEWSRERRQKFQQSRLLRDRLSRRYNSFDRKYFCFPDPMNWWAWRVGLNVNRLCKKYRPDVLWATGYPWSALCLLSKASERTGIPAVGDIRDPWSWHPRGFWSTSRHKTTEANVFKSLSNVVVATEGLRREYKNLYHDVQKRIELIRNGFVDEDLRQPSVIGRLNRWNYVGSLSSSNPENIKGQTLFTFAQALRRVRERSVLGANDIRVTIAGNGTAQSQLLFEQEGLADCVSIKGCLPLGEARLLRDHADVLLVVMGNGPKAETYVPLKVYEYLAANRPILAMLPRRSEAGEIILKKKRGVVCRIDDVKDIAGGIERILKGDFEFDPKSDVSEYSCRYGTEKLAKLFDSLVHKQKQS